MIGMPVSPPRRSGSEIGMRRGTAARSSSASRSPPPRPKMSLSCRHDGHAKYDMFSIRPSTGMFSFWYIATARRVSATATCCGDVTTIAPATYADWLRLSATSPVPGRQVDDQVVEIVPAHVVEELADHAVQHRPAPDDRRVVRRQEAHRHHLQVVLLRRDDLLAVGAELALQAEHDRHVGAVDVGVDDAHAAARARQREREVHGHGGLAHATLAGADRDEVLHAGNRGLAPRRATPPPAPGRSS